MWSRGYANRLFYPLTFSSTALVLVLVAVLFEHDVAMKGTYVIIGLLVSYGTYRLLSKSVEMDADSDRGRYWKLTTVLVSLSLAGTAAIGSRLVALFVGIPLGFFLLAVQYRNGARASRLLPQICLVFALDPATKYLTTGFYFATGDTLSHATFVGIVASTGAVETIPTVYASFPGLHALGAIVVLIMDLSGYQSLVVLGIVVFSVAVFLMYCMLDLLADERIALAAAFALITLTSMHHYAMYFFPQALATVVALFIIYLAFRVPIKGSVRRFQGIALLASLMLVVTHHLTLFLFVPIILTVSLAAPVIELLGISSYRTTERPWTRIFPIVGFAALFYWTLAYGVGIYYGFYVTPIKLLTGPFWAGGGSGPNPRTLFNFGAELTTAPVLDAGYVYNLLLVVFFALGVKLVLDSTGRYRRAIPVFAVGLSGAALVFETPLSLKSLSRIAMPFSFFFAAVLGVGLHHVLERVPRTAWRTLLAIVLVVSLGTAGAITTADDVYELQHDRPSQTAFSSTELAELRAASHTVGRHNLEPSTFWLTGNAVRNLFQKQTGPRPMVTEDGIRASSELFMYRDRWPKHQIRFTTESKYLGRLYVSRSVVRNIKIENNKVHTTGSVGMVWSPNGAVYEEDE